MVNGDITNSQQAYEPGEGFAFFYFHRTEFSEATGCLGFSEEWTLCQAEWKQLQCEGDHE